MTIGFAPFIWLMFSVTSGLVVAVVKGPRDDLTRFLLWWVMVAMMLALFGIGLGELAFNDAGVER